MVNFEKYFWGQKCANRDHSINLATLSLAQHGLRMLCMGEYEPVPQGVA